MVEYKEKLRELMAHFYALSVASVGTSPTARMPEFRQIADVKTHFARMAGPIKELCEHVSHSIEYGSDDAIDKINLKLRLSELESVLEHAQRYLGK